MLIFLIVYICSALANASLLVFAAQLLPNRLNVWKIVLLALGQALFIIPVYLSGWNFDSFMPINLLGCLSVIAIPALFFQGEILKRAVVYAFFLILLILSGILGSAVISSAYGDAALRFSEIIPCLIYNAIGASVFVFTGSLSVIVRRMFAARRFQPFYLLFFILPIGQIITIYSFIFSTWTIYWLFGVALGLVADLVLLAYTISQEKKTELEEALRETHHRMALEQFYYREVEQRREELARIRNDFNTRLAAVARLVRDGEERTAQELIHTISKEINGTQEYSYCAIPVVNAILAEKARECRRAGITLDTELDIPAQLTVEQMHLCSIFSNLLDNAITACRELGADAAIRLSSKVDGDYLFIKVTNPSNEPPKNILPGRGYGMRILSDLAARYGGDYQSRYRDGMFTAVASLLAVGQ